MAKRKLLAVTMLLCIGLMHIGGCGGLATVTPETPLGDPNAVTVGADIGTSVGGTMGTIGVATGNPLLVALGTVVVAVAGILGTAYGKKK